MGDGRRVGETSGGRNRGGILHPGGKEVQSMIIRRTCILKSMSDDERFYSKGFDASHQEKRRTITRLNEIRK